MRTRAAGWFRWALLASAFSVCGVAQTTKIVLIGKLTCGARLNDPNHVQTWCYAKQDDGTQALLFNGPVIWLAADRDMDVYPPSWGYDAQSGRILGGGILWRFRFDSGTGKASWKYQASAYDLPNQAGSGVFQ